MILSACTYSIPKLKIVSRPTLLLLYNCRPHTFAIGSTKMTKSETALIADEVVCAAFSLMQWPGTGNHTFCTGRHWKASPTIAAR